MPRRSPAELNTPPVRLVTSSVPLEQLPEPPAHLSEAMQGWWRTVMTDYALEAHHLRLLEAACDAWDRMVQAREVLRIEGLTIAGRDGRKAHPAVAVERDSRLAFARLVRELDLDAEPPPERPAWQRPPALRSNRRR
jgi:P27 family predicted phage terminase small subunit